MLILVHVINLILPVVVKVSVMKIIKSLISINCTHYIFWWHN